MSNELKQLLTEQEAIDEVRKIVNSVLGKRWMVAVWCVEEADRSNEPNVLKLAGETTWRFPQGDFKESLRLLREKLDEQLKAESPPVPTPLEMAPFLLDESCEEDEGNGEEPGLDELLREKEEQGGKEK